MTNENTAPSSDRDELLHELIAALQPEVRDFPGEWDAFTVAFTAASGLDGITLQQVDPVFYLKNGAFAHGVFSRSVLEPAAVRYIEASAGEKPFELAVAFVTYVEETNKIQARIFMNEEAVPMLITPDSWAAVAQAANPFRS